jgi:hypothetical protein
MGFWDALFYRDPSRDWPEHQKTAWVIRPESGLLNREIQLGMPAEELRRLGKPSNRHPFKRGLFQYPVSGLDVEIEGGKIVGFLFLFGDKDGQPRSHPDLSLSSSTSSSLRVTPRTTPEELIRMLGPLDDDDNDNEEYRYLIFRRRTWSVDVEFRKGAGLEHLIVMLEGDMDPGPTD